MDTLDCIVCCNRYTRSDRIPRILHCNHTFCTQCLLRVCHLEGVICTVSCPLCRWITCTSASLTLPGSLWINTEIWDKLGEEEGETADAAAEEQKQSSDELCPLSRRRQRLQQRRKRRHQQDALSASKSSGITFRFQDILVCVPTLQ